MIRPTHCYTLLCTFLLLTISVLGYGQDQTVLDRLNSESVNDLLYIRHSSGKFCYRLQEKTDKKLLGPQDIDLATTNFSIGSIFNRTGKVTLYLEFYNPLVNTFNSTVTEADDPTSKVISDFIAAIPTSVISLVDVTGGAAASAAPSKTVSGLTPFLPSSAQTPGPIPFANSLLLYEWINEYERLRSIYTGDLTKRTALINQINKIELVENYLYDKLDISSSSKSVGSWVKDESQFLYDAGNNHQKFSDRLTQSTDVSTTLESSKQSAYTSLNDIIKFITDGFDNNVSTAIYQNPPPTTPPLSGTAAIAAATIATSAAADLARFKQYSQVVARVLARTTTADFKTQDEVVSKFSALIKSLKTHLDTFREYETVNHEKIWFKKLDEVTISKATPKLKDYTLILTPKKADGTSETDATKLVKASFQLALQKNFVPFVSTSAIFSPLAFPNYAVEVDPTGKSVIGTTNPTRIVPRPVLFLNFLNRFGKADPDDLAWHLQIGFGTVDKNYLIPVGAGLLIGGKVSVSGGFLGTLTQDLKAKGPGQPVKDDTELKNLLGDRFIGSYYFSLNIPIGLGKKTK